jgi:hypothetical protein
LFFVTFYKEAFQAQQTFLLDSVDVAKQAALETEFGDKEHAYDHEAGGREESKVKTMFNTDFHTRIHCPGNL